MSNDDPCAVSRRTHLRLVQLIIVLKPTINLSTILRTSLSPKTQKYRYKSTFVDFCKKIKRNICLWLIYDNFFTKNRIQFYHLIL